MNPYTIPGITTINPIEHHICRVFGITPLELKTKSQKRAVSIPRYIAMYLFRKHENKTCHEIAKRFKKANHATTCHAITMVQNLIDTNDRVYAGKIAEIEKAILEEKQAKTRCLEVAV